MQWSEKQYSTSCLLDQASKYLHNRRSRQRLLSLSSVGLLRHSTSENQTAIQIMDKEFQSLILGNDVLFNERQ